MISCADCIQRMKPDDPRVPVGLYHQSGCDSYCNKPTIERDLEQQTQVEELPPWGKNQWNTVNQLRGMVLHLQEKVYTLTDKKTVDKQYTISK